MSTENKNKDTFIDTDAVHFRTDILPAIQRYIKGFDAVKVCSAWFTDGVILNSLTETQAELIIGVPSKLDPSCPEFKKGWSKEIYDALDGKCYLYYGKEGSCHNKFMVFGNYDDKGIFIPVSCLTGSYNYTISAKFQLENIIYIVNSKIATQYLEEFNYIKARCHKLSPQ
jgi:phosphatidylserine/phosphatidylglycerophosphate/cardiolipin synthase-like enzyme